MGNKSSLETTFKQHLDAYQVKGYEEEFRFHPVRRWRFDFAFPAVKVALEVQGGTWIKGGHSRGSGIEKDCEKLSHAAIEGWKVLLVDTNQVKKGLAIKWLMEALEKHEAA